MATASRTSGATWSADLTGGSVMDGPLPRDPDGCVLYSASMEVERSSPDSRVEVGFAARVRGYATLLYAAVSMVFFFLLQMPSMLITGTGDFSMWLARRAWAPSSMRLAGVKVEVVQLAPLPEGAAIYASNHESALDIWAIVMAIPRNVRFLAKKELFRIPIFGWYLRLARFVEVDRQNHARAIESLHKGAEAVRNGLSLVVFPEGTRSPDATIHAFKKGPFVLAERAGVPVVPVAIAHAAARAPKGQIAVFPGTIRIAIGPAVDPAQYPSKDALLREVRARIIQQHVALGGRGGDVGHAIEARGQEGGRAV